MTNIPLCVDLDGTLIKSDMMFESMAILIKSNPIYLLMIPIWFIKGKLYLKEQLFNRVQIDIDTMPLNDEIVNFLINEKKSGRTILLVTASLQYYADKYKEKFNFLDEAIGSKDGINLSAKYKAEYLKGRFGDKNYDYIGDSHKDLVVWSFAQNALIVSDNTILINKAKEITNIAETWGRTNTPKYKIIFKQLRIYQWVKNLLIFLPALLAHSLEFNIYFQLLLSFLSFSFVASSIYIFNDLMDLNSDRKHKIKKNRPLAAGNFRISDAFVYTILLMTIGIMIGVFINISFIIVLLIYLITTYLYSIYLKRIYIVDIITLALLYTMRIIAGSATSGFIISEWLAAFALFFFFSMGALKRFTELKNSKNEKLSGRAYIADDMNIVQIMGICSSMISVLVMVLYINSNTISQLYSNPKILYLIIPILLHWNMRVWVLADRSMMNEDPIVFSIKDKYSYLSILLIGIIMLIGII